MWGTQYVILTARGEDPAFPAEVQTAAIDPRVSSPGAPGTHSKLMDGVSACGSNFYLIQMCKIKYANHLLIIR